MQTSTSVYTSTSKTADTRTTLVGGHYAPMKEPLSSSVVSGTACLHCGNDAFTSQDAMAAQQRIQGLEEQVRELTVKASEAAGKIVDYENEVRHLTQALHNHSDLQRVRSTSTASPTSETPDTNAQQQQGRFAGFASYFPYRRTNSRTGSKDSSTPPNTSHSNHTSSSPGAHISPTSHTRNYPQRSLSQQDSTDHNAAALQAALSRERSLRKAAESQLSQAHSELEELTAQLFSQANEMVAQERKARAKLEERVVLLEKRDSEKRKRLDRLEKAIARVERVRELINC
ncbi:hypothetical protein UA08_06652 [Talaromyces atroroseus]|uniref:GDP/GTP exchange factor Sec2 N-terminal domain-containing protein n=1 Tax=Talaromyces atroroseus TaxID=1441469 RepID=A0A225ATC3_TALAT|nr:hypothetical protein UA08_06652 [Talaromyces atroroseus]OKL58196.1 hypothetical protein UA08_06652 [Talaromyces atroroseus]